MSLRWERQSSGGEYAYSGDLIVALITPISAKPGRWAYSVSAVQTRWVAKGHGEVSSAAGARRAVTRCWEAWLARAALKPADAA